MEETKHRRRLAKHLHFVSLPPHFIPATQVSTYGLNLGYRKCLRYTETTDSDQRMRPLT